MVTIYDALTTYEGVEWHKEFKRLGVEEIFDPLFFHFKEAESMQMVVRYILYAYTKQSPKVTANMEWVANKKKIFTEAGFEADWWDSLGLLTNEYVVTAIHRWLTFQEEPLFKQIQSLKDLHHEMQLSANNPIKKSNSEEIDYDQKYRNAGYARELAKQITELETKLLENDQKLKAGVKEVKEARKMLTTGIEKFIDPVKNNGK